MAPINPVVVAYASVAAAVTVPTFDWNTVNTYIHCANMSGGWSDDALAMMKKQNPKYIVYSIFGMLGDELQSLIL